MHRTRNTVAVAAVAALVLVSIAIGASSASVPSAAAATSPPAATTGFAKSIGVSSDTLYGVVNPGGQATTYHFEYGTTANYGAATANAMAGSGTGNILASAIVTGLTSGTTYHYRVVADNAGGTTHGDDQTFTAGVNTSQVRVMGREGFVSPGGVIGVELGCFDGQTTCSGHVKMTHNGTLVGERNYTIAPESGGFQNLGLTSLGRQLVSQNSRFHLLGVNVTVNDANGQTLLYVIHLARWVWH